ncbi:hypothetical protein NEHOM01_0576 [Nematocida homosporus]|uniref:uncharacterized protein n=1 Tax=Nematocida homosporus TaxID=1912981 RepID=UPI002220FD18|nr:uncharacterized protein NEHOM01_0576 [Nematocida homosporus]KAI5185071.1 hypothetical protein NEHOM01_0576 [Nematocida homosporus]
MAGCGKIFMRGKDRVAGLLSVERKRMEDMLISSALVVGVILGVYGNLEVDDRCWLGVSWLVQMKKFWYITHFSLLLATIGMGFGACCRLRRLAGWPVSCWMEEWHLLLVSVLLPVEVVVAGLFWPVWWYDPHLVFSRRSLVGCHAPGVLYNVCTHGLPVLFLGLDYLFLEVSKEKRYRWELAGYAGLVAVLCVGHRVVYGYWRYRILKVLPGWGLPLGGLVLGGVLLGVHEGCARIRSRYFRYWVRRREIMKEILLWNANPIGLSKECMG